MDRIGHNKLVAFHFTLQDEEGNQLDTTHGALPMLYVHGNGQLPIGIELALEGKSIGDKIESIIEPQQGFGERDEDLVQRIPKTFFDGDQSLEIGQEITAHTENGSLPVRVIQLENHHVTVDGNHAFAGLRLFLSAEIRNVRNATAEELNSLHA